jgi:hypothetical protein
MTNRFKYLPPKIQNILTKKKNENENRKFKEMFDKISHIGGPAPNFIPKIDIDFNKINKIDNRFGSIAPLHNKSMLSDYLNK